MGSGPHEGTALSPSPADAPWRHGYHYAYLHSTGRVGFAWEWLRRTAAYQAAWRASHANEQTPPHHFGLEA